MFSHALPLVIASPVRKSEMHFLCSECRDGDVDAIKVGSFGAPADLLLPFHCNDCFIADCKLL